MTGDRLDDLVGVLVRLRRTSGGGAYDRAVAAAMAGAARVVLAEAERLAGVGRAPESPPASRTASRIPGAGGPGVRRPRRRRPSGRSFEPGASAGGSGCEDRD